MVKIHLSTQDLYIFSYFSKKTYVVGTHSKRLTEAISMSTHNMFFFEK